MFALGMQELDAQARAVARRWGWYVAGGVAVAIVGVLLLANTFDAVATLAVLVALALAFQGIDELFNAGRYRPAWPGYLLGALYVLTAVWAIAWPDITLWALALVVGVGFIVSGVAELVVVTRFHHDLPNRWVFVALGVVTVATGLMALAWPGATILVLAVLLGVRVLMQGVMLIVFGLGLRKLAQS